MNGCACNTGQPGALTVMGEIPISLPPITWKTTVLPGIFLVAGAALVGGLVYYAAKRK